MIPASGNKSNWPLGGNWSLSQDAFKLKNNKIEKKKKEKRLTDVAELLKGLKKSVAEE